MARSDDGQKKEERCHGLVEGKCRHCGEMIPEDTLTCPKCGRKRLFSQEQYDMLLRCSKAKDVSEWNDWRKKNWREDILLEGADLLDAYVESANLLEAHLESARLFLAHLEGAELGGAHLEGASFAGAHLEGADLGGAHLEGADIAGAHLKGADLSLAHLKGANLSYAHLEGAYLNSAHLEGADLGFAHLEGAKLVYAYLEGAELTAAVVDGQTLLWGCTIDRKTDFTGVGLASARVQPGLRTRLEYNIRRTGWEQWYEKHRFLKWPVKLFWCMSDYGRSTARVIGSFFTAGIAFAFLYFFFPWLVNELEVEGISRPLRFVRALYFSVVTMTTLGFGDMHAKVDAAHGWQTCLSHVVLSVHVLVGYVVLGALITRFAILFQSPPEVRVLVSEKGWLRRTRERITGLLGGPADAAP